MLKPSGGLFKKLFSPGRMASTKKKAALSSSDKESSNSRVATKAVSRMKKPGSADNMRPARPFSRGGSMSNRRGAGFGMRRDY